MKYSDAGLLVDADDIVRHPGPGGDRVPQLAGLGRIQIIVRPAVPLRPPDQILAAVDESQRDVVKEDVALSD